MKKTRLYIGIETKVRELDAKVFLACVAAEAGYDARIGMQRMFKRRLELMPRGIFYDKRLSPDRLDRYQRYQRLGFRLTACDEEGLSPWNDMEQQSRRQFSDRTLAPIDHFFAWGEREVEFVTQYAPSHRAKIVAVGNPRLDVTRPELRAFYDDDVAKLRAQYGEFILINSNFPSCNHFMGDAISVFKTSTAMDEPLEQFYRGLQRHQEQLFGKFLDMAATLAACFPDRHIVVRPHPSENHDTWRARLPQSPFIHVEHYGNVIPWLMASSVLIHNSCTTGIESYLVRTPAVAYRPFGVVEHFESYLPNVLSEQALSLDELCDKVAAILHREPASKKDADERDRIAARYMTGLTGAFSSDRIVERLNAIRLPDWTPDMTLYQGYLRLRHLKNTLVNRLKNRYADAKGESSAKIEQYKSQKFSTVECQEIEERVAKFRAITGRFGRVRVTQSGENFFRVYSAD